MSMAIGFYKSYARRVSDLGRASILMLCSLVAGCSGSTAVEEPETGPFGREPGRQVFSGSPGGPRIGSIKHWIAEDGTQRIEVTGSGFDDAAVAEVRDSTGHLVGAVELSGDKVRRTGVLPSSIAGKGPLDVRIRNLNGQYSRQASISISVIAEKLPPTNKRQCGGDLSGSPMTLYLGGGDAEKIFDQYLMQDADKGGKLPYRMKVKFYEQQGAERALQVVNLGEFEDLFVESRNDFLEKLKKRLRGRQALLTPELEQDAAQEKAQYFRCKDY
jgi:hypothetical protein